MSQPVAVVLTRHLNAPPSRVYDACTQPELLAQWFSPRPFHVCEVEADVRVGGRFSFRMTGDPGTFGAEGEYLEIVPGRRLTLTWRWTEGPADQPPDGVTSRVTFEFAADGPGTRLTLRHEQLPTQEEADSHQAGWMEALDKLQGVLSTL